jgi:hypothetical protein
MTTSTERKNDRAIEVFIENMLKHLQPYLKSDGEGNLRRGYKPVQEPVIEFVEWVR